MTPQTIIETVDITKVYGKGDIAVKALDGVSLRIDEGEFIAIMGPSGSGKSTLMNIIGCLDRPTEGSYTLAGSQVSKMDKTQLASARNRYLGFIFQSYNLLPRTSAIENVMLPLFYHRGNGMTHHQIREKAEEMLELVGLEERMHHMPHQLSGGQQQRVAIARSLVNHPALILADEPTGNLDTHSSQEVMELLTKLNMEGRTIVMVTHDHNVAGHSTRTITIRDGKVESDHPNGSLRGGGQ
jgi:putative ABC transport system ATP-binding protein